LSYIWFDDKYIYEIEQHNENDKIYFKNDISQKTIFENYKLIKQKSTIFVQNKTLYFNKNILLENIENFNISSDSKHLTIKICENFCEKWIIIL